MISIITDMIFAAFPMIQAAYVFGSFAAEEERAEILSEFYQTKRAYSV